MQAEGVRAGRGCACMHGSVRSCRGCAIRQAGKGVSASEGNGE
jgi:hypothetical protein